MLSSNRIAELSEERHDYDLHLDFDGPAWELVYPDRAAELETLKEAYRELYSHSYYVEIDHFTNGYMSSLDEIKNALYTLFGDVLIASDDELLEGSVEGGRQDVEAITVKIIKREE